MQSSSALSTMGVSMEQNIAMGIAMNETLQDSSKSGNALKSIASNMAGVRTGLKSGNVEANKTAKAMEQIAGIKIWDKKTGDIKGYYETMDELAGKWDSLSEAEQNALGSTIAGKTQLNAFNAMMNNWDTAKQYMQDYKAGMTIGSAEKEKQYSPYVQKCA